MTVLSDVNDPISRVANYTFDGAGVPQRVSPTNPIPTTSAVATVLNQASASVAAGVSANLSTTGVSRLFVGINLTAFTAGTAPTVQFFVDVLGVDGIWYQVWASAVLSAVAAVVASIGPGCTTPAVLGATVRLRWAFGGTVPPTAVTFSASIVGR